MFKHTLTAGMIGMGIVAVMSAQGAKPAAPDQKARPSSTLLASRPPVNEIPKAWGRKTPWGDPDLQGIWNNGTSTPLQREPQYGNREYLTDQELVEAKAAAAKRAQGETEEERQQGLGAGPTFWYEIGDPVGRTSLIYDPPDGRLPPTTAQFQSQLAERARLFKEPRLDKSIWERQGMWVRCISRGVPASMNPVVYNNNYQIIQAPGYVVIHEEMIHTSRIIPLDGRPHVDPAIRMWEGDARGRWEGDTLVVETTNFHPEAEPIDRQPHVAGRDYKVVQRFTRVSATEMDYRYTLDAPSVFTRPWSAAIPMTTASASDRITEYACIEGDNSVRLTITGLIRLLNDPEYAARVRAQEAAAPARGGGPAGAPPGGAPAPAQGPGPGGGASGPPAR
jgi:hypothetical protein